MIVETKYDLQGRVQMVSNPYRQGDTAFWSLTEYDSAGRAKQTREPIQDQDPSEPTGNILGTTTYDISTAPGYIGTVVMTTDAALKKSRSITNALGQLIVVEEPDHTGNLPALPQSTPQPTPSPNPSPTPHGQCISPECPENLSGGEYPSYATYYDYNAQGKMVKVTQGVQSRYFKYDSLGRLIRVRQPEQEVNASLNLADSFNTSGHWTAAFVYDLLGNVVRATDANGVNIINDYDKAGRLVKRCYTKPNISTLATTCSQIVGTSYESTDTPAVLFFYDGVNLTNQPYSKGKLTKVYSTISETRNELFDIFGRVTQSSQTTDGNTYTSRYTYNFAGALVEEEYPSGRKVKNEFEADGDLASVTSRKTANGFYTPYVSNFSYTASGGISQMKLGNGRWETAKFNTRMQVTELGLGTNLADANLWKTNYEYGELDSNGTTDPAKNTGNIAKQILTVPGTNFTQAYKYDSLNRITEAKETTGTTQNWIQTWGFDRYGNRTGFSQNIAGNTVAANPAIDQNTNRFSNLTDFAYDKNGNITRDLSPTNQLRTFVFNGDNKQTEVKDANGATVGYYYYDGEGKRVKRYIPTTGETTIFVYSSGKLVAEYSTVVAPASVAKVAFTTTDHLGSPRVITDALGQVSSRRDFMPFGEDLNVGVGNRTGDTGLKYSMTGDNIRQKFTGYQKDNETQLDFAEARMYENRFGRFTAVDPLLASGKSPNPQTFNRFTYVGNNPLIRIDPNGREWIVVVKARPDGSRDITPTWVDPDEYDGEELWTKMIFFSDQSQRWIALNPNSPEYSKEHSQTAAYWKYGLYSDFEGGYEGLFEGNSSFDGLINDGVQAKDLAYLVAYMKTGDGNSALAQLSKIAIQNGLGLGLGRYLSGFLSKAVGAKATDQLVAKFGSQALVPKAAKSLGIWGETRLAQVLGGAVNKNTARLATSLGDRVPDFLIDGIAHEAKAGLNVGLTSAIRKQVLKDVDLISKGGIKGAHWHFFQGAQKELLDYLTQNGIKYTVH